MRKKYQSYRILSARTVSATGPRILERGGGGAVDHVAVVRGRSPSPGRGVRGHAPPKNFEHLEYLKWHFLHSEKAKCLILQFANNKI